MVAFPPCKINLGLHIVAKRHDGYHDIETVFYPIPWTEVLEVIPATQFEFTTSGIHVPGEASSNLCVKAYNLLKREHSLPPVKMHLHKLIPTGAGLGGGSSDAAHALRLLNQVFDLQLSIEHLMQYAAQLGSDCAFFIQDGPMLGTGRGEQLQPLTISLKGWYMAIVKPEVHVSTAEAYALVAPAVPASSLTNLLQLPIDQWKNRLINDFESSVFQRYPVIATLKQHFYELGASYASMSGSGAAVFGLFEKPVVLPEEWRRLPHWQGNLT